ncbi:hypothetical protein C9994_11125 [Marivirga lumbricoides]|uniref:Uncharacterized protein n=1 Tax=Marivirga lumbricoides TaxID=1046115 RepID=A0A2T4DP15_9BACT|nr:hypothetical protein C9994_11125 [Marivirga lumbricoides]
MIFGLKLINTETNVIMFNAGIVDWIDFIGLLFPQSTFDSSFFGFNRSEVLDESQINLLNMAYDNNELLVDCNDLKVILEKLKWKALENHKSNIHKIISEEKNESLCIEKLNRELDLSWQGTSYYFDSCIGILQLQRSNIKTMIQFVSE